MYMIEEYQGEERRFNGGADIHRDLGRLEGRVGALENAMTEIKGALTIIFSKLNEIKEVVSKQQGSEDEKEKSNGNLLQLIYLGLIPLIASAFSVYLTVKFLAPTAKVVINNAGGSGG